MSPSQLGVEQRERERLSASTQPWGRVMLVNLAADLPTGLQSARCGRCPDHSRYDYTVEVRNRFKGLDLIDRLPDERWNEVRDIVQETGNKTISMEKKFKKAKWLSGEPYK